MGQQTVTGADIKGELARFDVKIFEIAAVVRKHPRKVGEMLNGRRPLTPDVAQRILQAIREVEQKRGAR